MIQSKSYISRFSSTANLKAQATAIDTESAKQARAMLNGGYLKFDIDLKCGQVLQINADRFEIQSDYLLIYNTANQIISAFARDTWLSINTRFPETEPV